MLQGISEADAEQVEFRLLSDPGFGDEFDIMVDTIVDQYLEDELSPEGRNQAEQYFFQIRKTARETQIRGRAKKRKADLLRKRMRTRGWTPYLKAAAIAFVAVVSVR